MLGPMLATLVTQAITMTGLVVGLGLIGLLLHALERRVSRRVAQKLGWRAVLITGWLGVPLHELSHLAIARLLGQRIVDYRLFAPNPATGTLGYVRHAYLRPSVWQPIKEACIAIAPLIAGLAALTALLAWTCAPGTLTNLYAAMRDSALRPTHDLLANNAALAQTLGNGVALITGAAWRARSVWLPLQLYLVVAVTAHMAPSTRDLRAAGVGLIGILVAAGLAVTLIGAPTGVALLMLTTSLFVTASLLTLAFQVAYGAAAGLIAA